MREDGLFDLFLVLVQGIGTFVNEKAQSIVVELSFLNWKFLDLASVIETLYDLGNGIDGTFLDEVHIHLVTGLPINGDRLVFAGDDIECLEGLGFRYDGTNTGILNLLHRDANSHVRHVNVDDVLQDWNVANGALSDVLDDTNSLKRINYMFTDFELKLLI